MWCNRRAMPSVVECRPRTGRDRSIERPFPRHLETRDGLMPPRLAQWRSAPCQTRQVTPAAAHARDTAPSRIGAPVPRQTSPLPLQKHPDRFRDARHAIPLPSPRKPTDNSPVHSWSRRFVSRGRFAYRPAGRVLTPLLAAVSTLPGIKPCCRASRDAARSVPDDSSSLVVPSPQHRPTFRPHVAGARLPGFRISPRPEGSPSTTARPRNLASWPETATGITSGTPPSRVCCFSAACSIQSASRRMLPVVTFSPYPNGW